MNLASIVSGQKIIYDDDACIAVLGTAAKGHVRIFSKEEKTFLQLSLPQAVHLFSVANQVSVCAFDALSMQGTNIIVNNEEPVACVDVVARKEEDGISFQWELRPGDPAELDKMRDAIADALDEVTAEKHRPAEEAKPSVPATGQTHPPAPGPETEEHKIDIPALPDELLTEGDQNKEDDDKKENYLFSELRRVP